MHYQANDILVERICVCIKHSMRCLEELFIPYLQEFEEMVVGGYKTTGFSTYVYCAEFIVTVIGRFNDAEPFLLKLFNEMCETTFAILKTLGRGIM
jgi:hypothetical protein